MNPGVDGSMSGAGGVGIPRPRRPLDDLPAIERPAAEAAGGFRLDNGSVEPMWRYNQYGKRGKHRRYNGYVERIGGAEREQLRQNLAAAVHDLLDWAAQQAAGQRTGNADKDGESATKSRENQESESETDGGSQADGAKGVDDGSG